MRVSKIVGSALCAAALVSVGCNSSADQPNNPNPVVPPGQDPMMMQPITQDPTLAGAGGAQGPGVVQPPGNQMPPGNMMPPVTGAGTAAMDPPANGMEMMPPANAMPEDPRGCPGLDSGFPGDEACLLPPDPSEGMQIHVGPSDYNDMAEVNKFIFPAGRESSECWTFHTPNSEEVYYQGWVLSGRTGTHHIINTMYSTNMTDGGFGPCADPGTGTNSAIIDNLPGASKPYMPREPVAPENMNLGRKIPPNTSAQADMHYFNFGDSTLLREFWLNIYYIPKEQVQQEANQIRGMGGLSWTALPIPAGADQVYPYSCPITQDGRIIQLLGHYHAHGVRFTAWVNRNKPTEKKVFEMYDYLDPQIFNYNSVTQNPTFSDAAAGATSGILEVKAGDTLDWECHIINDSNTPLRYTNEVQTGEMCNLWGASVGPDINCVVF